MIIQNTLTYTDDDDIDDDDDDDYDDTLTCEDRIIIIDISSSMQYYVPVIQYLDIIFDGQYSIIWQGMKRYVFIFTYNTLLHKILIGLSVWAVK